MNFILLRQKSHVFHTRTTVLLFSQLSFSFCINPSILKIKWSWWFRVRPRGN